jgi:hypothetical protein
VKNIESENAKWTAGNASVRREMVKAWAKTSLSEYKDARFPTFCAAVSGLIAD